MSTRFSKKGPLHKPHVMINMAMSVDGKASSKAREPTTFTSREDKRLLMEIRSRCDALIVAAGTVRIDRATMSILDPKLSEVRIQRGQLPHPIRVIVSGHLSVSPSLPAFRPSPSPLIIVCSEKAPPKKRVEFARLGRLLVCGKEEVDVKRLIAILAKEYRAKIILSEGGPTLNDAFFRAKMVDELFLTICPRIVGGTLAPTIVEGKGMGRLKEALVGRLVSCRKGETEWFLRYRF